MLKSTDNLSSTLQVMNDFKKAAISLSEACEETNKLYKNTAQVVKSLTQLEQWIDSYLLNLESEKLVLYKQEKTDELANIKERQAFIIIFLNEIKKFFVRAEISRTESALKIKPPS
jgi:antirestriction protein